MSFKALFLSFALLVSSLPAQESGLAFLDGRLEQLDDPIEALDLNVCLQSVLAYQGLEVDIDTLRALTGDSVAPLLQSDAPFRDPLLTRWVQDGPTLACEAMSVEAAWHVDMRIEQAVEVALVEIHNERPVIASRLVDPGEQCGYQVLMSANRSTSQLMAYAVNEPRHRRVLVPPGNWSGPVPGDEIWAGTPLFTANVTHGDQIPAPLTQLRMAIGSLLTQVEQETIPLSSHPAVRRFTDLSAEEMDGEFSAHVGPAAARAHAAHLRSVDSLDDFTTLWQTRILLEQHIMRRDSAARFFAKIDLEDESLLAECASMESLFNAEAETSRAILALMWDQSRRFEESASSLLRSIRRDPPVIVDLNPMPAHERQLLVETIQRWPQPWEMERRSTPWGPILTVDSPEQRERVAVLYEQLATQMEETLAKARAIQAEIW